ncbi:hypothetical protein GLOIN_2v1772633 [Rhizophagus clarus]|uniref:Uncharacterized protein n=1 Tax=Rhizophagus clarus TaxID=94130 RepID=A0A8H3QV29_9GLOM|nr:hypothetical protein GLOIN_2v1772633 [Rhizophagus clarus]
MSNNTVKRRELEWENVSIKIQDILFSLMQAINAKQKFLLQISDNKKSDQNVFNSNENIVITDSTKIKKINTTSSSLNHRFQNNLLQFLDKERLEL